MAAWNRHALPQGFEMIVVWRITERCNLSCKFCAYDRELPRERRDADERALHIFGKLLGDYQRMTGDSVLVSWLGGEPLLWAPLTKTSKLFRGDYGLRLSTTTNGTTLGSAAVRQHLLACYAELTISVDGFAPFHNSSRGWKKGFESLRHSVSLLARAIAQNGRGPVLKANVVLMRDNLGSLGDLCLELAGWGIQEITFNQLGGVDRPEFFAHHRLLPEHADWLCEELPRLIHRLAGRGVRLRGGTGYLRRIGATARGERLPIEDCHPGESFLFISERGMVAPCHFTSGEYGIPLEEIDSVSVLQKLPARFATMRRNQRSGFCEDCHSTQIFEKFSS